MTQIEKQIREADELLSEENRAGGYYIHSEYLNMLIEKVINNETMTNNTLDTRHHNEFLDVYNIKDYKVFIINPDTFKASRIKENNPLLNYNFIYEDHTWAVKGIEHNAFAGEEYIGNIGLVCKLITK